MARYTYPDDFDGTFWTIIDADYYVSTIGNDISGDGSPKNPYLTVKKAFEFALDGEKVIVGPDEYVTESALGFENSQDFGSELPCRLATTQNIDLFTGGLIEIDGITPIAGERILVWQQTNAIENGIYLATADTWLRADDFNSTENIIAGRLIPVLNGDSHANAIFQNITEGIVGVGSTDLTFLKVNSGDSGASIQAGSGVTLVSGTLDLGGDLTKDVTFEIDTHLLEMRTSTFDKFEARSGEIRFFLDSGNASFTAGGNGAEIASSSISLRIDHAADIARFSDGRAVPKGIEYAQDYSGNFTDRSLVDKAFVDALVGVLSNLNTTDKSNLVNAVNELKAAVDAGGGSGGGGWLTSGTTNIEGDVTILNGDNDFTHRFEPIISTTAGLSIRWLPGESSGGGRFIMDYGGDFGNPRRYIDLNDLELKLGIESETSPNADISFENGNIHIFGSTDIYSDAGTLRMDRNDLIIEDFRSSGLAKGFEYNDDYSAGFGPRSLVDKAYVDGIAGGGTQDLQSTLNNGSRATITDDGFFINCITNPMGLVSLDGTNQADLLIDNDPTNGALIQFSDTSSGIIVNGVRASAQKTSVFSTNLGGQAVTSVDLDVSGILITDARANKGAAYADDYSANFTERSLVDKAYVDSVAGGGGSGSLTNGSGTRVNGSSIDLGGTLTSDAIITGNDKNFSVSTLTAASNGDEPKASSVSFKSTSQNILNEAGIGCSVSDDGTGEVSDNISLETSHLLTNFRNSVLVEQRQNDSGAGTGEVQLRSLGSKLISRIMCDGRLDGSEEQQTTTAGCYFNNSFKLGLINDMTTFGTNYNGSVFFGAPDLRISMETSGDAGSSTSEMTIIDTGIGRGILYGGDYSANYEPRSLVDKGYVDSLISALALANGLTNPL